MSHTQAMNSRNERYQTREDLHHAEAVESALRDVVEDQSATIEQMQEVMDAMQDEIAHLQAQLVASSARECVCGGESQS